MYASRDIQAGEEVSTRYGGLNIGQPRRSAMYNAVCLLPVSTSAGQHLKDNNSIFITAGQHFSV